MLIVVVHGVNTRSPELPDDIRMYIERYLALSNTSEQLHITYTYWGDLGGAFRFGGRSRPRTRYRSQGMAGDANIGPLSEFSDLVAEFPLPGTPRGSTVSPTGYHRPQSAGTSSARPATISSIPHDEVTAYLLGLAYTLDARDDASRAALAIAIDEAASEESLWEDMAACQDIEAELEVLRVRVLDHLRAIGPSAYVTQGQGQLQGFFVTAEESLKRIGSYPGFTLSKALAELRPKLDGLLEQFVGDVFAYLASREPDPMQP